MVSVVEQPLGEMVKRNPFLCSKMPGRDLKKNYLYRRNDNVRRKLLELIISTDVESRLTVCFFCEIGLR